MISQPLPDLAPQVSRPAAAHRQRAIEALAEVRREVVGPRIHIRVIARPSHITNTTLRYLVETYWSFVSSRLGIATRCDKKGDLAAARLQGRMCMRSIMVRADWDDEAKVWVATSSDIDGLVIESEKLEDLGPKLRGAILDLIELNRVELDEAEVPVFIHTDQVMKLAPVAA